LLQELHASLKKVQQQLSKYGHVNKKALDQFVNFTEQKEELARREAEISQSGEGSSSNASCLLTDLLCFCKHGMHQCYVLFWPFHKVLLNRIEPSGGDFKAGW
jgi:hypothetical protein